MDLKRQTAPVSIAAKPGAKKLSREQTTFNSLIRQIEASREALKSWDEVGTLFQAKLLRELVPVQEKLEKLRHKMVLRLDQACQNGSLTKTEKKTASGVITQMASELMDNDGMSDLRDIYSRHSGNDPEEEEAAEFDEAKMMAEILFGVDVDDVNSPDELMEKVGQAFEEHLRQERVEADVREERRARRKKSAKQLAAEARDKAEQAELSLSIREIYRKLVNALHPDREPDPAERVRKTELMQRVNLAYNQKNLLQLFELQLELEHIDQHSINNIDPKRLKHYNKILREQANQLKAEVEMATFSFKQRFDLDPFSRITPRTVMQGLSDDIRQIKFTITQIERDLKLFVDPKALKNWLRNWRKITRDAARMFKDDDLFF